MPTFRDPVYHMGGVPAQSDFPFVIGNVYFVSSVAGSSSYDGKTKDKPFNTFARAMAFTTTNDCVVLMPGHAETITTTADFAMNQIGLTVWGLGRYDYRPTFTAGATTSYANVTAANVHLHNVKFLAAATGVAQAVLVEAKGFKMSDCVIEEPLTAASANFDHGVLTGATANEADGLEIENCTFYMPSGHSSGGIVISGAHNDIRIFNNRIAGWWSSGGGPIYSDSTIAMLNIDVGWNMIANTQSTITNQTMGIKFDSKTGTGYIYHNYIICESSGIGPAEGVVVNATCTIGQFNNLVSGESMESGLLTPAVYAS